MLLFFITLTLSKSKTMVLPHKPAIFMITVHQHITTFLLRPLYLHISWFLIFAVNHYY